MFSWFSQDTEEIAELLVMLIVVFVGDLKQNGNESLRNNIERLEFVREFHRNKPSGSAEKLLGVEAYSFYLDGKYGKVKEFFFNIEDDRKIGGSFGLHISAEDQRYYGFGLYCDLLTGMVAVDARDSMFASMNGQKATRRARRLCKVFARKYASATSGRRVWWGGGAM
jgi:hypothetical protein